MQIRKGQKHMESILSRHVKLKVTDHLVEIPVDKEHILIFNKNYGHPLILPDCMLNMLKNMENQIFELNMNGSLIFKKFIDAKILVNRNITLEESIMKYVDNMRGKEDFLLTFVPSYRCNFKCEYCLVDQKSRQCKDIISRNLIKKIPSAIDEVMHISPINPFKSVNVKILGGEPTLEMNWSRVILLLELLNKKFELRNHRLITNGTLLSQDKTQEFMSLGGNEIQLSFDVRGGTKSMNTPQNRENVEDMMKLATMCVDEGALVTLDLKVDSETLVNPNLSKLCEYIRDQELDSYLSIYISRIINIDEYDPTLSCDCIPDSAYYDIRKFDLYYITEFIQRELPLSTKLNLELQTQIFPCKPANLSSLLVYPNGDLTLCGKLYASLNPPIIGSLKSNPIFFKNKLKEQIHFVSSFNECSKCGISLLCGGKCILAKNFECSSAAKDKQIYIIRLIAKNIINTRMRLNSDEYEKHHT